MAKIIFKAIHFLLNKSIILKHVICQQLTCHPYDRNMLISVLTEFYPVLPEESTVHSGFFVKFSELMSKYFSISYMLLGQFQETVISILIVFCWNNYCLFLE